MESQSPNVGVGVVSFRALWIGSTCRDFHTRRPDTGSERQPQHWVDKLTVPIFILTSWADGVPVDIELGVEANTTSFHPRQEEPLARVVRLGGRLL